MRGSEFIAQFKGKSLPQWESAAVVLSDQESFVPWPLVPITVTSTDGKHQGTFYVSSDYFAIGTPDDYVRLPLTPLVAQRIANSKGMLLPTAKMVDAIWRTSLKLTPQPMVPNKGADLAQYLDHSKLIDAQLAQNPVPPGASIPVSGQKKDIVLSNIWKPGKVVIYGWHRPDGTHIQPLSNVHGDFYVDYSHGIRFVSPNMEVDGVPMSTTEVLQSRELSSLLSDEGPIKHLRYPAYGGTSPAISYFELGSEVLVAEAQASMKTTSS